MNISVPLCSFQLSSSFDLINIDGSIASFPIFLFILPNGTSHLKNHFNDILSLFALVFITTRTREGKREREREGEAEKKDSRVFSIFRIGLILIPIKNLVSFTLSASFQHLGVSSAIFVLNSNVNELERIRWEIFVNVPLLIE